METQTGLLDSRSILEWDSTKPMPETKEAPPASAILQVIWGDPIEIPILEELVDALSIISSLGHNSYEQSGNLRNRGHWIVASLIELGVLTALVKEDGMVYSSEIDTPHAALIGKIFPDVDYPASTIPGYLIPIDDTNYAFFTYANLDDSLYSNLQDLHSVGSDRVTVKSILMYQENE